MKRNIQIRAKLLNDSEILVSECMFENKCKTCFGSRYVLGSSLLFISVY